MAENTIQVEIVTPEHKVVHETATEITVPGKDGYLGILPGHAPLISELAVGEISYKTVAGETKLLAVAWGFVEVLPNKVTILAETAERAEDIDVERAQRARAEAEVQVKAMKDDFAKYEADLQRANTRLDVAAKIKHPNLLP